MMAITDSDSESNNVSIIDVSLVTSLDNVTTSESAYATILEAVTQFMHAVLLSLSVFGTTANALNLRTFWKLLKQDPINVNLFGLALSDLMVCLTALMGAAALYAYELFINSRMVPLDVTYLVFGAPHSVFVRVTVLHTAFVSIQRCVCVIMPLKVRGLFTHKRLIVSEVFCFGLPVLMIMGPLYHVNKLQWTTVPWANNVTILRHVMTDEFYEVNAWSVTTNSAVLLVIPFVSVVVSTAVMTKRLKEVMSWRLQAAHCCVVTIPPHHLDKTTTTKPGGPLSVSPTAWKDPSSKKMITTTAMMATTTTTTTTPTSIMVEKERRIIKMVLLVCVVFLVCSAPNVVTVMFVAFGDFNLQRFNISEIMIGYGVVVLDTLNSSMNILIYYNNSINYKNAFRSMWSHGSR